MAADVMTGNDENCLNWIAANREPKPEGEAGWRCAARAKDAEGMRRDWN
jgi:hypothetical protein